MKICCLFNIAPRYRESIYTLMQNELQADIFFGDYTKDYVETLPWKPLLRNHFRGNKLVWQTGAIRKAFSKRYNAYILTGNPGILSNWVVTLLARLSGRKVYLWSHGLKGSESPLERLKLMLYFRLAGNALLYGEGAKERLSAQGFTHTTVIYNSLDYDKQLSLRNELPLSPSLTTHFGNENDCICFLGRLTPFKKVDLLLEAIEPLSCNLVIVGSGSEEEHLQSEAKRRGLEQRIWFYGSCFNQTTIASIISQCKATVSPSSIGLTAIHSLMFGTPVITHNNTTTQMPEAEVIEEGVTGHFFKEDNVQSLQDAISTTLQHPQNREACYKRIDSVYNPHHQLSILKSLFEQKN